MPTNPQKKSFYDDINSVETPSKEELTAKSEILAWIKEAEVLFRISKNPDTPNKHACFYGILVDKRSGVTKLALFEHKKSGLILPPGGHLDANETPFECVKREMYEELGITESEVTFPQKPFYLSTLDTSTSGFHIELWYLIDVDKDLDFTRGVDYFAEYTSHDWYTIDEIKALKRTTPTMPGFIKKLEMMNL